MFNQEDFEFHRQECYHEEKLNAKINLGLHDDLDNINEVRIPVNIRTKEALLTCIDNVRCLVEQRLRDISFIDDETHYWACLADYALQELFKRAYKLESTENVRNTEI